MSQGSHQFPYTTVCPNRFRIDVEVQGGRKVALAVSPGATIRDVTHQAAEKIRKVNQQTAEECGSNEEVAHILSWGSYCCDAGLSQERSCVQWRVTCPTAIAALRHHVDPPRTHPHLRHGTLTPDEVRSNLSVCVARMNENT